MPQALVGLGAAIGGSAVAGAVGASAGTFLGVLAGATVATGISYAGNSLLGNYDVPNQVTGARGISANKSANDGPLPVIYGSRGKVGGYVVFKHLNGDDNKYLHIVIALCEGEISAINDVYLDDVISSDSRFSGLVRVNKHTGASDQTADSDLVSEVTDWTTNHRLRGVAYVYVRLTYSAEAFTREPVITCDIDGKLVYDPRDTNTKFSSNPALCIRDYLTDTTYGKGLDESLIDDTALQTEANYCDEDVTIDGTTQDRYTCDGVVDTSQKVMDNVKALLTSCRGMLVFTGGLHKLIIDKPVTPESFGFDESNITGSWSITLGNKNNTFNRMTARFFNPDRDWQPDFHPVDSTTYRTEDNELLLKADIQLPYTANYLTAGMIAAIDLKQSRQMIKATFTATIEGTRCEVGDVVPITHTTPGWSSKYFRVIGIRLKNNHEVVVSVREYDVDVYTFSEVNDTDDTPDTNLPDPFEVLGPSAIDTLTNVTAVSGDNYAAGTIHITFTAPVNSPNYKHTEIWVSTDDSTYYHVEDDADGDIYIDGLGSYWDYGDTVYIKLRNVNQSGVPDAMPGSATNSVSITAVCKMAGFYAGQYDFWGGNADIDNAATTIVIGNIDSTPEIKLGPSANSITFAGTETGVIMDGAGNFRAGSSSYGMSFNASTGVLQADKVRVGSGTYIDIDGGNARIRSSNYVSGMAGAGFTLEPGLLEVGNIAARGIIRTAVFQKDIISAVGGNVAITYGTDVLNADMTAADSSPLTIEGNETWAVGDILRIKDGTDDEWFTVSGTGSAPTYNVTRDEAGSYGADSNPTWKKGATVVNYGQSGDGGILLTASETNAPYMSIFTHAGSPWSVITTHIREGNLNGYAGYSSDVYGWAAYIDGSNYIKIDPVSGIQMSGSLVITGGSGIGNLTDAGDLATADNVDWSTQVTGSGKPDDNADVTSSNTAADTSAVNGVSSSIISGWRYGATTYINGGDIYTNTVTATQINGGGFGTLTITSGKIAINTTDALQINSSGNILVDGGGDIILTGHDSNAAKLTWNGSSYDTSLYLTTSGSVLYFDPGTTNVVDFYIGNGTRQFGDIYIYGYTATMRARYNSSNQSQIALSGTAGLDLRAKIGGTDYDVTLDSAGFRPAITAYLNLGSASYVWNRVYSNQYYAGGYGGASGVFVGYVTTFTFAGGILIGTS